MKKLLKSILPFKFCSILSLTFFALVSHAQIKLNGSYVSTKVNYLSGDELPEENTLKYTYLKYTFSDQDQIGISGVYYEKGNPFRFSISGNRLIIKNEEGFVINTMKVLEHTENKLVIVSGSTNGSLEDPWAIKNTFYKEQFIQNKMPLNPDDIFSIKGVDTIYKSGQKIYAQFKGSSFQSYIYEHIRKKKMDVKSGKLTSTFIIDAKGYPDSLRIIQGINPKYDAEYIKAFNSVRNMWLPAQYNGKAVKVLMNQSIKYFLSEHLVPSYFNSQKANTAYNNQDYELALYYFDKALEHREEDIENLYRRGICKQKLGDLMGACTDWTKIQLMDNKIADELLLKYCK